MCTEVRIPESPYFTVERLADGVYAAIIKEGQGAWSNAGIVDLGEATLVFDTTFLPSAASHLRRIAEELTGNEIQYVVNSHWHGDHIMGNQVFRDAVIFSTPKTREKLAAAHEDFSDIESVQAAYQHSVDAMEIECQAYPDDSIFAIDVRHENNEKRKFIAELPHVQLTLPTVTFEEKLLLQGTSRTAVLLCYGGGHTEEDAFLYLPDVQVAFMGDLVTVDTHPFLGAAQPREWLTTLERVKKLDIETIVSGHGAVGSRAYIDYTANYVEELIERVEEAVERGETLEEVLNMPIPAPYATWRAPHVFKWNLKALYDMVTRERYGFAVQVL
jgi:glyoxylase-like metal-dependent hydrolase (beta-lactamase superfamily II)